MFKYKTCKYDVIIEKVEITKESKVSVWLKRNGHVERKVSNYNIYHDTFADATIWLLNKRISKTIKKIVNENTGNRIIIVTHPDIIQSIISKAIQLSPQHQTKIYIKTGSASQISYFESWASLVYSGYIPL